MVHVKNYALRERKDGETFISLELAGGLEMVQSPETIKFFSYVCLRKNLHRRIVSNQRRIVLLKFKVKAAMQQRLGRGISVGPIIIIFLPPVSNHLCKT